jgi:hypothetical protein
VEKAEYFYCTRRGGGVRFGASREDFSSEGLATLDATIGELARNLRAGHFFADPSNQKICDFCEWKIACGKGSFLDASYAKKKSDPSVASFQTLRGALDADEGTEAEDET